MGYLVMWLLNHIELIGRWLCGYDRTMGLSFGTLL